MQVVAAEKQTGDIKSEARGPHWIAWVAGTDGKPIGSVVLVGETQEEAESRARDWARGLEAARRPA
jgi:hypothetical protein